MNSDDSSKSRRDLLLLIAVVLANTLPFVNRAIHLDENTYLAIAHNVFRHFWFPQDFPGLWFGIPVLNFSGHTHPVGVAWFLALLMKMFHGDQEWKLRLGFIVFPAAFAMATYFLARRFTQRPLLASLLTVVTPAVLVFSPTLMPDLPMATFWLWAVVAFCAGLDEDRASLRGVAGLLLVMATLVSYQALFMCAVLMLYAWRRGERRWSTYLSLFMPVIFLALYWYAGYRHYGFFAAERTTRYLSASNIFGLDYFRQKLLGMLTTLGATTVFGLAALWIWWKSKGWKIVMFGCLLVGASVFLVPRDYRWFEKMEYMFYAASGLALVWITAGFLVHSIRANDGSKRGVSSDLFLLSSWFWGVVLYTIFLCEFSATRYIAALAPPVVILFVRETEKCFEQKRLLPRRFLRFAVLATWIVALLTAYADYQFVGAYRDFSRWVSQKYSLAGGSLWVGTEAGLRYYMEREGARTLVNGYAPVLSSVLPGVSWGEAHFGRPAVGDLLVRPKSFLRYDLSSDLELSAVIGSKTLTSTFPIRTFGFASHAGLHGTNVGLLPVAISDAALDQIEISRFTPFAAGFEQARKDAPPGEQISFAYMTVNKEKQPVISIPPGAVLTYAVPVSESSVLKGEMGIDDSQPWASNCWPILQVSWEFSGNSYSADCTYRSNRSLVHHSFKGDFYCSLRSGRGPATGVSFKSMENPGQAGQCPAIGVWNLELVRVGGNR
jgi:hypothetical protein